MRAACSKSNRWGDKLSRITFFFAIEDNGCQRYSSVKHCGTLNATLRNHDGREKASIEKPLNMNGKIEWFLSTGKSPWVTLSNWAHPLWFVLRQCVFSHSPMWIFHVWHHEISTHALYVKQVEFMLPCAVHVIIIDKESVCQWGKRAAKASFKMAYSLSRFQSSRSA